MLFTLDVARIPDSKPTLYYANKSLAYVTKFNEAAKKYL